MVPVVMEKACKEPRDWEGAVGFRLAERLYIDCSDENFSSDERVAELAERIKVAKHQVGMAPSSLKYAASSVLSQRLSVPHRRSSVTLP